MGNSYDDHMQHLREIASHVQWQTNPFTGAALPQPTIGQGSATNPQVPPAPGQVHRGS